MQKKRIKVLVLTLIMGLLATFSSYAKEGMGVRPGPTTEAVYKYFNEDNSMLVNQWKQVWNNWYYFGEDGYSKQNTWAEINGKWYYFDQWSVMQHSTTTPDGHEVGSDGIWIQGEGETAPLLTTQQ